jgi:hypothetical protein
VSGLKKLLIALVIPGLVVILASFPLVLSGHGHVAEILCYLAWPLWMASVMAYIAFIDSRKRWPNLSWQERFAKVMTFGS